MSNRDLLATLFSANEDAPVLAAIEALARGKDCATALLIELIPDPIYLAEGAMIASVWNDILAQSRADFAKEKAALERRCSGASCKIAIEELESLTALAGADVAAAARRADLAVMLRPEGASFADQRRAVFEEVLFGSGRPVLLVPPQWRKGSVGRNIVVGWSGKRESARALADAMELFPASDQVAIVTVNAKAPQGGRQIQPGSEIVAHLARKGLTAELRNIDAPAGYEGEALLGDASSQGADLLVIGGYGKTRLREWVFGGVTRTLTHTTSLPLFLSH